jgi:signal transduction histidine kinase/CheY-like chemotaxis protein
MLVRSTSASYRARLFPDLPMSLLASLSLAVGVGIIYFTAARLSLALLTKPDGVAVFWPAAGVAAGILVGVGPFARLPVIVGVATATIVANLLGDRNIWSAIVFAACNAAEALLVATLIHRFFGLPFSLDRLHHALGFIAVTIFSTAISGIGGTLGYVFFHASSTPSLTIWQHWFSSDTIGVIAIAPVLLELTSARELPSRGEIIEGSLALGLVTALSAALVHFPSEAWAIEVTIASMFPLFLWIAARCRPAFSAIAILVFALTIVWATTFEIGIFGDLETPASERILTAQFSILVLALCALVLAALFAERRHLVAELRHALQVASDADRAKTSFLAAASHDLRQPLQTLNFLQASLRKQVHGNESRTLIAQIDHTVNVMNGMLLSLLDINRIEAGILRPSISDFPVNALFAPLAADFLEPAMDKGLKLRMVKSRLWIRSDRRMLDEMMRNLLSNAVRYTDEGRILIGCRRVDNKVRIEVWDSGVGIMGEDIPRIFEEHYQAPRAAHLGGFGLGLAIVQRMAKTLDHRVDVKSTPGRGSGFSIEVELGHPDRMAAQEHASGTTDSPALAGTVLLIEDEGGVRLAFTSLLESYGLDVIAVATADQALRCVAEGRVPHLVISDYNLPGKMNGIESIKALRKVLRREVPAIVVTGDTRTEVINMIKAHGVGLIVKPARAEDVLKLLSSSVAIRDLPAPFHAA